MGKHGTAKPRFIDPRKEKCITYHITGMKAEPTDAADPTDAPFKKGLVKSKKNKAVMFQLRSDISQEPKVEEVNNPPYSLELFDVGKTNTRPKVTAASASVQCEADSTDDQGDDESSSLQNNHHDYEEDQKDPNDLTRYGIYFDDGYDYSQHLRDSSDSGFGDSSLEIYMVDKEKQPQKSRHKMVAIQEENNASVMYEASPSEFYIDLGATNEDHEIFSAAEADDNLADNLMELLDGDGSIEIEDLTQCPQKSIVKPDYSQMPPLEDVDGINSFYDDDHTDNCSNAAFDMSVSDNENDNEDAEQSSDDIAGPSSQCREECLLDPAQQDKLNRFFDVHVEQDPEDLVHDENMTFIIPKMQSSREVNKEASTELQRNFNDKFNAMMLREYDERDLGGNKYYEDDGPSTTMMHTLLSKTGGKGLGEQRVQLVGPDRLEESAADAAIRRQAIQYSKNWRNTRPEMVEVSIPNPKGMQYDVVKFPTIKNKNMPSIIDLSLIIKKKKGLTMRDMKDHDKNMNTPHRDDNDETQTCKTMLSMLSYRPPDESSEERRERKTAVKEIRKERRVDKKLNTVAQKEKQLQTVQRKMNAFPYKSVSMI